MRRVNPVVWTDGLFLRSQHLQEQNRVMHDMVYNRYSDFQHCEYGFYDLNINQSLLSQGVVSLFSARGVFKDGSAFTMPECDPLPDALTIDEKDAGKKIYLALPIVERDRYKKSIKSIQDCYDDKENVADVVVGKIKPILCLEGMNKDQCDLLHIATIKAVRSDKRVILDVDFIAPLLDIKQHEMLTQLLQEFHSLVSHRVDVLASRLVHMQESESAMLSDFLLLQMMNRYYAQFDLMQKLHCVHPWPFYQVLYTLLCEVSTYTCDERRASCQCDYQHGALLSSFDPVVKALRLRLSSVLEQHAMAITLLAQNYGVYVADMHDLSILDSANFIIAVSSDSSVDEMRKTIPNLLKVASVDEIRDLVSKGLQGVTLDALTMAPRQIPFSSQCAYFSLKKSGAIWDGVIARGSLALHLAGQFTNVRVELWAIRN